MLDTKFIKDNIDLIKKNNTSRNVKVDIDALIKLEEKRTELLHELENLRATRNQGSKSKPTPEEIKNMKELGTQISKLEQEFKQTDSELQTILLQIPNINHESTPIGKDDSENQVLREEGVKPTFTFEPKEHFEIEHIKPLIDLERGAKIGGSRFYYLKDKLAILERALMQFAIDTLTSKGFELILPPVLVQEPAMFGTGFFPAEKNEVYSVNPGEDNLYLVGTSEVPLIYMYSGEVLDLKDAPKKYIAITPCFRREAGSYGKDTKGIFRVHQFYKVEMVVFCKPEDSWNIHEEILANEEGILRALGLPYQVLNICSGDLGFPAAKKYDCEGWFPGQGRYRELTSTSNTTDYQARRSNIKYKTDDGKREFVHTLNGTAVTDRCLLAILENFQQPDGSVIIPEVLQKYTGFDLI
jgi:seryl-tRNA synthetase